MELGLSLGDTPATKPFFLAEKSRRSMDCDLGLGFCVGFGSEGGETASRRGSVVGLDEMEVEDEDEEEEEDEDERECSGDLPVQLNLLPFSPVPRQLSHVPLPSHLPKLPWQTDQGGNFDGFAGRSGLDVNRIPSMTEEESALEGGTTGCLAICASSSSPTTNSGFSPFLQDFSIYTCGNGGVVGGETVERTSSRASDEEENGSTRKKLRLSKEQSAYLEESFKEHHTLNPKQKHALAKQLNLQPRQVEVWFQNRRARTKLKQTEVDCEYLKRCCEKLTEENRRLQKELQDLRALKTAHPFYMHVPATTLTMCPSCERVASTTTPAGVDANGRSKLNGVPPVSNPAGLQQKTGSRNPPPPSSSGFPFRPMFLPFNQQNGSAAAADGPKQQHSAAS